MLLTFYATATLLNPLAMRYFSPLRYPGGKACLTGFLSKIIETNDLRGCVYYEPYAGGAGAALGLLKTGAVSRICINDADERINAFWAAAVNESSRFVDQVLKVPLSLDEWHRQRAICAKPQNYKDFEVGFAAFYMNRCNRSGVLTARPIGGLGQEGKWKLDVRFNRETLSERILELSKLRDGIQITRLDAIDFLKTKLPRGRGRERAFVYLDPPYVHKGQRLYLNAYENQDHVNLAHYLGRQGTFRWIMSYDDTELVRSLYANYRLFSLPISYTLQEKRLAKELVVAPKHLALPFSGTVRGRVAMLSGIETPKDVP